MLRERVRPAVPSSVHAETDVSEDLHVLAAQSLTCPVHGWNRPCRSCALEQRARVRRQNATFGLGVIGLLVGPAVARQLMVEGVPWKEPKKRR